MPDLSRAAALLQDFGALWSAAHPDERRRICHTLLESVYLDCAQGPVVAMTPRPEFAALFAMASDGGGPVRMLAAGELWASVRGDAA